MEAQNPKLNVAIVGGNGAVGRDVIQALAQNPNFQNVLVITRRMIDEWNNIPNKQKFQFLQVQSLENLKEAVQDKLQNIDTCFCCLGSRVNRGKELFFQVDFTFVVQFCELAKENGVPHYSVVTTQWANPKSMTYMLKVKGQVEEALKKIQIKYLSIFRPGLILDRRNDKRVGETIASCILKVIPVFGRVKSTKIAETMLEDCCNYHYKRKENQIEDSLTRIFKNNMIKKPTF